MRAFLFGKLKLLLLVLADQGRQCFGNDFDLIQVGQLLAFDRHGVLNGGQLLRLVDELLRQLVQGGVDRHLEIADGAHGALGGHGGGGLQKVVSVR